MNKTEAWLLDVDPNTTIALGRHELLHLVQSPGCLRVPKCPDYCNRVILWHKKVIPIMDIGSFVDNRPGDNCIHLVAIAVHRNPDTGGYGYGGIKLENTPTIVYVDQSQGLSRSDLESKWNNLAVSGINIDGYNIPVIDVTKLFLFNRNNIRI